MNDLHVSLYHVTRGSLEGAGLRSMIEDGHYLHTMPDPRTSYEAYKVLLGANEAGALVFGRPEATRCADWYGAVADVKAGRCEVTRWQVLNLARVWLYPKYQVGGECFGPERVPGYLDRRGQFRSTLASAALSEAVRVIGFEYLRQRPPCFLDEPYEIRWLLSYCDTRLHRGTIYQAAGFELYRTNERGIQTWRKRLPALTRPQHVAVADWAVRNERSIAYRAKRAQLALPLEAL